MPYSLPEFNLDVRYRHPKAGGGFTAWIDTVGQITGGTARHRLANQANGIGNAGMMTLKLPAHTDIREGTNVATCDEVEAPSGSGIKFAAYATWDVATGFPNEYRCAALVKLTPLQGQGTNPVT